MAKKQFKAESKKLLDLMINSIYTNKEIFLRELISNASDAIDKLYYQSLTNDKIKINKDELKITIELDKKKRKIVISDNGCGMTKDELENNLGVIAKSGSLSFKEENKSEDIDIIGQFGVGFYSAFMVAKKIKVESKSIDSSEAYEWKSEGADGYTIKEFGLIDYGLSYMLDNVDYYSKKDGIDYIVTDSCYNNLFINGKKDVVMSKLDYVKAYLSYIPVDFQIYNKDLNLENDKVLVK